MQILVLSWTTPSWIKISKQGRGWNKNALVCIFQKVISRLRDVYSGLESFLLIYTVSCKKGIVLQSTISYKKNASHCEILDIFSKCLR